MLLYLLTSKLSLVTGSVLDSYTKSTSNFFLDSERMSGIVFDSSTCPFAKQVMFKISRMHRSILPGKAFFLIQLSLSFGINVPSFYRWLILIDFLSMVILTLKASCNTLTNSCRLAALRSPVIERFSNSPSSVSRL